MLYLFDGLICTDVEVCFEGQVKLTYGIGGEMAYFRRKIDKIKIGEFEFTNCEIDFGDIDPKGEIQGLIGLDVLKSMRAVIDVEIPQLLCKNYFKI